MTLWIHELRLMARARLPMLALALLLSLTIAALVAGVAEVSRQKAEIAAIPAAQSEDVGAVMDWLGDDPGQAAYYTFHATWDPPSRLAFAALGMRDVSPFILRIRALSLEAQIYDGDNFNPELALPGRFDFAFVLVFLGPLFVIVLFHDLISSEREAGRLRTLQSLPHGGWRLWLRRGAVRYLALVAALGLPFVAVSALSGVPPLALLAVLALVAAYLLFWVIVAVLIGRLRLSSVANAASLAAVWLVLVLIAPTLANVAINRAVPVDQGAEIALASRERVNAAWDIPRETTMDAFYATHPELAGSGPLPDAFHYKWYFAFHQVGDESVVEDVRRYRQGLERRDEAARRLAWVLPSVGAQALLTRLAGTDLEANLAYQDRIRDYHRQLRQFYYGYLFNDRPFEREDFARAPEYAPAG